MSFKKKRIDRELHTIRRMVDMHCTGRHGTADDTLCDDCAEFMEYAEVRLEKCPYGEDKPTCANCPIHCYKPERRAQVRMIMRYAGPRMALRHPWLAITHKADGLRRAKHPKELTREERLRRSDRK